MMKGQESSLFNNGKLKVVQEKSKRGVVNGRS